MVAQPEIPAIREAETGCGLRFAQAQQFSKTCVKNKGVGYTVEW